MDRKPDIVRIDDFGVARPTDRGAVVRFKNAKGTYRLLPSPARFVVLERHVEGEPALRLRLGGEIGAPGMLCDVCALISQAGWHGELIVWSLIGASESSARSIFFDNGNILGAQSTAPGERLGEVMYKLGALDRDQILAVTKHTTPERRFGQTAVDLGFVPRERLFDLVRTQTEEIVYAALRCSEGTFWFVDGFDPTRLAYRHRVSAQTLLMEGVRRMDEAKYFRDRIPTLAHVPARLPIRLDPPEDLEAVFEACDGARTVMDIGRAVGLGEFETTHALFRLTQGGFVHITAPRPNTPEAIVEIFNAAIRPILDAADGVKRGAEVRAHLAAFASGIGVYDALFVGAGPARDGSLEAARVARNVVAMAGDEPNAALSQWLHDYLSFALFDATTEMPRDRANELANAVTDLVAQLAPKTGPSSVVPPAHTVPKSSQARTPAPPARPRTPPPAPPAYAPPPSDLLEQVPSPPAPQLPALAPMPTPPPETRPSLGSVAAPKATQMQLSPLPAIFDDPTRDPMPAPLFTTSQTDAATDATRAQRVSRRRATRTALLAIATVLLLSAAVGAVVVSGIVTLPLGEPAAATSAEPAPPKSKAAKSPSPTSSVSAAPASASVSASISPSVSASVVSDIPASLGRLVLRAPAGFRVFVDNKVVGNTPDPVLVLCGQRAVKIGSHGSTQQLAVPCGGELEVYAK